MFTEPDRAAVQQWRSEATRGGEGPVVEPCVRPPTVTVASQGMMNAFLKPFKK